MPRDAAVSGYWDLTVAGVEKVVIREAGRHTLKVVERRDERTGITITYTTVGSCCMDADVKDTVMDLHRDEGPSQVTGKIVVTATPDINITYDQWFDVM